MATRKPVEVVEFVPFEQRTSKTKPQRADAGSKKESVEERKELNFQEAWKDVHKLGVSQLEGKEKKIWEANYISSLGGKVKHKEKMPFKMFMGVTKKRAKREATKLEEIRQSDLVVAKSAMKRMKHTSTRMKGKKKRADTRDAPVDAKGSSGIYRVNLKKGGSGKRRRTG